MERGDLKFRYRYQDGKAHKMVDYFQLWDYITERLPTPEELQSGDENVTKRAIKKYLAWYARLAVKGVEGRERAKSARAAEQQNGEKGWCLGCRQRGGECQCAELGTDPEWVDYEPSI